MSPILNNGIGKSISVPHGFEVTWAGPLPDRTFGLGSEDGRLLLMKEDGTPLSPPFKVSPSLSAVNGVTANEKLFALSTREEVTFWPRTGIPYRDGVGFPHGAHGIAATTGGYFIAPMGLEGIMAVVPPLTIGGGVTVFGDKTGGYYVYRLAYLSSANGTEIIVIAALGRGFGITEFHGEKDHNVLTGSLPGAVVVDCCPMFPGSDSTAVVALCRDRRLLFFRDIQTDRTPMTLKFETLTGNGYRVLSCSGDVYVVTSEGFFTLAGLADQCMRRVEGEIVDTRIMVTNMEVVDANLCGTEWLLVVTPDGVEKVDIQALHQTGLKELSGNDRHEAQPMKITSDIHWSTSTQRGESFSLAG